MHLSKYFVIVAAAMLLIGSSFAGVNTSATDGVTVVYVSNPDDDTIYGVPTGGGTPVAIYTTPYDSELGDLVIGPDQWVYACDPANGKIISFNLTDPDGTDVVLHDGSAPPTEPQCGWLTHTNDLVVTDVGGSASAWIFLSDLENFSEICDGVSPCEIDLSSVNSGFSGGGVTQAAPGHLLIVDSAAGQILEVEMNQFTTDFYNPPDGLVINGVIAGLDTPNGIARSSRGNIYVATDGGVEHYGDPLASCVDLGLPRKDQPFFLEFAADDTLYVATTSNNKGKLWQMIVENCDCVSDNDIRDCSKTMLFEFAKKDGYGPSAVGIGVPFKTDALSGSKLIAGHEYLENLHPDTQLFTFQDHAYEFRSDPPTCEVEISATETEPNDIDGLIGRIRDEYGNPIDGEPVLYLGDDARGIVYDVNAESGNCDGEDLVFRHAINAFTGYIANPRIARCPDGAGDCSLIELIDYFPFNGVIPEDGRIGSKTAASFSRYFLVDVDLNQLGGEFDTGDGEWCGFASPMYVPEGYDPSMPNPDVLTDEFISQLPVFSTTETIPLKFRVADLEVEGGSCDGGPFLSSVRVLFSIAQVREYVNDVLEPTFRPAPVFTANSSDPVEPAIFNDAGAPTQYYHFNAKFTGYDPGVYEMVLVSLTNNFRALVVYFVVD